MFSAGRGAPSSREHAYPGVPARCAARIAPPFRSRSDIQDFEVAQSSDMRRSTDAPLIAKDTQITLNFRLTACRLFWIVRELDGRSAVDRGHLADDRDRIEIHRAVRCASDEIICQIGPPAKTYPDSACKMTVRLLDRIDIHGVGKNQQLLFGITPFLFPPLDYFFACRDRRRTVRPKARPIGHPFRRVSQE